MAIRVKLTDIVDGIECQSDENSSFLNKQTGEVILISDYEMRAAEESDPIEDFPDWEQDQVRIAREILAETGDYIPLPTKFEIDEYRTMERFCLSLDDPKMSDLMYSLIQGGGAFRRFKDAIREYNIADEWHRYRDNALKEVAIEWCRENDIEFDDEQPEDQ
ncbi:MAG: hypothetical protein A2Z25_07015 [Planctomycetes bacterium RBG_16_55_9]|nr:MAG: hypothetical protein A2Z25_07015 [Planctomycetes bacterium RBG_16_55_9]